MTLQELRIMVSGIQLLANNLNAATSDLADLANNAASGLVEGNIFGQAINPDLFVQIYTPIYLAKLQVIEAAADALGTDGPK